MSEEQVDQSFPEVQAAVDSQRLVRDNLRRVPLAAVDSQRLVRDNLRRVPLAAMNPAPYNPRTITDEAFGALKFSLEQFGMVEAIVWNSRSGNIVGGHQRYRVLKETGHTDSWAFVVDLDEIDEKALNLTLNNPQAQGVWQTDALTDLIKMMKSKQKPEDFKKSGLMALEKQLPLFDARQPSAGDAKEVPTSGGGQQVAVSEKEAAALPKSDVKIIQLFYKSDQYKVFMEAMARIGRKLGTENVTETAFKLAEMAMAKITQQEAEEATAAKG
jgi:ParB-like nuclease family protein